VTCRRECQPGDAFEVQLDDAIVLQAICRVMSFSSIRGGRPVPSTGKCRWDGAGSRNSSHAAAWSIAVAVVIGAAFGRSSGAGRRHRDAVRQLVTGGVSV
jgi:hypothetical protein